MCPLPIVTTINNTVEPAISPRLAWQRRQPCCCDVPRLSWSHFKFAMKIRNQCSMTSLVALCAKRSVPSLAIRHWLVHSADSSSASKKKPSLAVRKVQSSGSSTLPFFPTAFSLCCGTFCRRCRRGAADAKGFQYGENVAGPAVLAWIVICVSISFFYLDWSSCCLFGGQWLQNAHSSKRSDWKGHYWGWKR